MFNTDQRPLMGGERMAGLPVCATLVSILDAPLYHEEKGSAARMGVDQAAEGSGSHGAGPLTGEQLFQALGDCAYELDTEFRFVTYNEGCAAYYGCPIPQALGRPIWEALPQTRASPLEPLLRSAMASRQPKRVAMAGVVHPDRWIEVTLFPTQRGLGVAFRDRTAERRAAKALRASEERFRILDRLGQATARAVAAREIMELTARLLGQHLRVTRCAYADVDADNDRFTIRDDWTDGAPSSVGEYSLDLFGMRAAADMRAGRTLVIRDVDAELPTGDGADMFNAIGIKAVICCPLVKQERLVAMMAVHQSAARDWTQDEVALLETVVERAWAHIERIRAEEALRENEQRLRLIVEGARDYAIFTTDAVGRINTWWPGAAAVFGWSAEEVIGCPVAVTFTPEDRAAGAPEQELAIAYREGVSPDVRWHRRKDDSRVFIEGSTTALRNRDGTIRGFLKIGQNVTDRKAAEERQALLMREVDHRAKNTLAMVQGMMRLTHAETTEKFTEVISGRVDALARVHSLLAQDRWNGADLHTLLTQELEPFAAGEGPRVVFDGEALLLPPNAAQPIAMIIHELATNALKYGALSAPEGRVSIAWTAERNVLRLRWMELGGPEVVSEPECRGFGSTMIEAAVRQLEGTLSLAWQKTGLVCDIEVSIATEAARSAGSG